jgi:HEPN domain-containing protein
MPDPAAEGRRWLASAREDLEYGGHAASGGHHAPTCFFAQQAAERR